MSNSTKQFRVKRGKILGIILILIFLFTLSFSFSSEGLKSKGENSGERIITKTYKLKYITPHEAKKILSSYLLHSTAPRYSQFFTVRIRKRDLNQFEELLRKIDHEKKNVRFKIYTIIASKSRNNWKIGNREINEVIRKVNSIFAFKSYKLDGISSVTVKDGAQIAKVKLSSSYNLLFKIYNMVINNGDKKRKINLFFSLYKEGGFYDGKKLKGSTIISSSTSMNDNGYFIAGVSKLGNNGDSLILVIKATVL